MNVLKLLLNSIDNIWTLWCILLIPLVGIVLIQYFPIPTLALVGLLVHLQLSSADLIDRVATFTGDEALRKRKYNCYTKAIIIILVTVACYGYFIHYDIYGSKNLICQDYTGDIPGLLPSLLQHVVTVGCPAP